VLEDESNRGGRHVTGAVVSRESTLLSRVDTLGISGVSPSQPHDILNTAEQWPSGYCRSTLFPGGPRLLPEALITPWPEMTTVSTKLWDLLGSRACSHSAVHTVTGLRGEPCFQRLRRQARYRIEPRMV